MSAFYVAVLEANEAGEIYATIPDLPGVNTSASTRAGALALAVEFANDYVRDLVEDGHPVPKARDIDAIAVDPEAPELGRALVPVEVPGKSVKISMSIDEALLARVDRAAAAEGLTRSAYIAEALSTRLRSMVPETRALESTMSGYSAGSAMDLLHKAGMITHEEGMLVLPISRATHVPVFHGGGEMRVGIKDGQIRERTPVHGGEMRVHSKHGQLSESVLRPGAPPSTTKTPRSSKRV